MTTDKEEIKVTPVHKSLIRPQLMFGGDRILVFLLLMATVLLMGPGGLGSGNMMNIGIGFAALIIGIRLLVVLAKFDPDAFAVFRRSLRYKGIYYASGCPMTKAVNHKD